MVRCSAVDPILKTIDIYPRKEEGSTQKAKNRQQKTINNYRNKGEKVSFKHNCKHSENRMNRGKDRNEGDKKGNSFVWGSGWRGGIITYIYITSNLYYIIKYFFYIAYITHTYNIQLLSYFLFFDKIGITFNYAIQLLFPILFSFILIGICIIC